MKRVMAKIDQHQKKAELDTGLIKKEKVLLML